MVNLANPAPRIAVEILFLDGGLCDGRKKIVAESRKCAPKTFLLFFGLKTLFLQKF